MKKNKYLMALSGMIIQMSIGSIYAYSIWIEPINYTVGWSAGSLKNAFILAICTLGLSAAFLGKLVVKIGPKKAGILAAVFFGVGMLGSGYAIQTQNIDLFYLFYGVISGVGLGLGYITPIGPVLKWFPDKPGFASGLIIMSFAIGSIIASQIISPMVQDFGVSQSFYILGIVYFSCMFLSALYLASPKIEGVAVENKVVLNSSFLKHKMFYALWFLLFLNTVCGIAIISKAAILGKEFAGMSSAQVLIFVGIIGLFNGLGRLFWSSISDKIGRWNTFMTFLSVELICFLTLSFSSNAIVFQGLIFVIISCYGGAFATIPAFIKDVFGAENVGPILGYVLTAWAAAGIAGPILITLSDKPSVIFAIFSLVIGLALAVGLSIKKSVKVQVV